jgi:hypothetical protein
MCFSRGSLQGDMLGTFSIQRLSMKSLALDAIRFCQRVLSPHKGSCCAYAAIKGHGSCSVRFARYGATASGAGSRCSTSD